MARLTKHCCDSRTVAMSLGWLVSTRCCLLTHGAGNRSVLLIPHSGNVPIDVKHKYWRVQLCKPLKQRKQVYFQYLNAWHALKESSDEAFKKGPSKEEPDAVPTFLLSPIPPYTAAPEHQAKAPATPSLPSHRTQHHFKPGKKHCMQAVPAPRPPPGLCTHVDMPQQQPARGKSFQAPLRAGRTDCQQATTLKAHLKLFPSCSLLHSGAKIGTRGELLRTGEISLLGA